jgi:gliding motility-associated-like protein
MIKDEYNCVGIYNNNPVIIQSIGGPEVTSVDITPDINSQSVGSININAVTTSDFYYSIYNGSNPQLNNGLFTDLSAGLYYCVVEDAFGCDTTFTVYVPLNNTDTLLAINGFGNSCEGETVVIPIKLFNFTDVYSFDITLNYDVDIVNCDGYINLNPLLESGFSGIITTSTGKVQLLWQGSQPQTIEDNTIMCELVFRGLGEGLSPINWESEPGESAFYDIDLNPIDASYFKGEIEVFSNPSISSQPPHEICTGDSIIIIPTINGGNGNINYSWSGPDGYTSTNPQVKIPMAKKEEAGTYSLYVEDSMQCNNAINYEVLVTPSPEIAFTEYDTLWVDPGYLLEAGYGAEFYQWNTGETTEAIVIDSTGRYYVLVTSYDGCKSGNAIQILWGGSPFYLPNAFTPNGDGLNDTFGPLPRYDYINRYHLSIYNRWGQMIFETTNINNGWDGTYQGSQCMKGAYVYRIVYEELGQQPLSSKVEGTVMLVR